MASGLSISLEGMDKVTRRLARMESRRLNRTHVKVTRDTAKLILGPLRAAAPVGHTRKLRKSVKIKTLTGRDKPGVSVGPTARHRHLVIGGTAPHEIRARGGGFLWFAGRGVVLVHHPGSRANPFVTRVFESYRSSLLRRFQQLWRQDVLGGG